MSKINIGLCFSRDFSRNAPLKHIGVKLPVYIRLLKLCKKEGWGVYVLTRKTYIGNGVFDGCWLFDKGKFRKENHKVKIDFVYDRSGGVKFPPEGDTSFGVVNIRDFKVLCWDKYKTYKEIGRFMPKTVWVGDFKNYNNAISQIRGKRIVLKPYNGLKGQGIFIGFKKDINKFEYLPGRKYIAQEFVDSSGGIFGITKGKHDLRIVIVNGKVVWTHVRIPPEGSYKANAASGGILTEIDYAKVSISVKRVVETISKDFFDKYDNPVYSLDFGIQNKKPYIYEINDQIGFPRWEMKSRDKFLSELVYSFERKIKNLKE